MSTNPIRGECEALRIIRAIAAASLSDISALAAAHRAACALRRSLRLPQGQKQSGRPLTVITPHTLRRIASAHAKGLNFSIIADQLGISRGNVRHHLKPSAAMLAACGF